MSVPVDLSALEAEIDRFGSAAFLVTASPGNRTHVVSVRVRVAGDVLIVPAGRTSRRNAGAAPEVTLLWSGPAGGGYCLLVDGAASVESADAEEITIRPTGAILHRLADASTDLPYCAPVDATPAPAPESPSA